MKIFELLDFNRELLRRFHTAGIRADDYKYVPLFEEYQRMKSAGDKVTYIVSVLAERYGVSERQVYAVIDRLEREIPTANGLQ